MLDTNFQKADKIFFFDRLLKPTILRLIPKWVYPNHITLFRFFATPIVVVIMLYENYLVGLIAFLIVASSDAVDGALARTRNQITNWGKMYDPLADKLLIASMVFVIVLNIDFWTAIIIIVIEAIIIFTAWKRKAKGGEIQANVWGKIKMALQVLGVTVLLLSVVFDIASLLPLANGVFYLAIAFAIVSLLTYGI